jgi:hypothetical protein
MRHLAPLPLVPGSWDDIVARAALKMVDWAYDRLSQRVPTLATAPLPADPWTRWTVIGGKASGGNANQEADERPGRDRP